MSSGTVDTRVVEMGFDNSNFESNVKQSMSTLERLKHALKLDGASAGLQEVERASSKLNFRDLNKSVDGVGKHFSALETIATGALLKIGMSAAEAGMKIAKSLTVDQVAAGWNKYAEKTTAVQTIMANLREDEGKFIDEASKLEYVNRYLDKLLWFSDETSYSFTDMTSNVGKFIANGQGLEESVTAMQGIATWAAMSGQNAQVASRAMYNISQAMGTGAMTTKDWMSIENANMATAQFKQLAITIAQKQGKIKEGEVTVEKFRDSLTSKGGKKWFDKDVMMEVFNTYGDAANRIQEYAEAHQVTSTEAIRKIKETDKAFADSLGFKAFAAAQEAKTFGEVVSATADAVSTKWMRIFENVFGNYLEAKELWTDLSEQMWEIFAAPLDTLNDIMSMWNRGFLSKGPANIIDRWFESGKLDDLDNSLNYVTRDTAKMAVSSDKAVYSINKLADGTEVLVKKIEYAPGKYRTVTKRIYDADDTLLRGREMLLQGFQNIFDTVIHDVENENGELESMSFFGSLKRGLQEVIFGTSEVSELIPLVSKKIWNFTKNFEKLTAKLKPSMETSLKLKNAFKGLFTIFKMGGKFIGAIFKPFKELFGSVFKNAPKNVLDLADSIGTWVQKLDQFLDEHKVFETVSKKVKDGLKTITDALETLSMRITGKSLSDLAKELKEKVFGFFEDYDFQAKIDSVKAFYNNVVEQIRQVKTGDLPETLTPFQKFLVVGKTVFEGLKSFFGFVKSIFSDVWVEVKNLIETKDFGAFFEGLGKIFSNVLTELKDTKLVGTIIDGLGNVFKSLTTFLSGMLSDGGLFGLLKTAAKIGIIGLIISLLNEFIAVWLVSRKVNWFLDSLYETFRGIGAYFHAMKFKAIADGAKSLGIALLLMAVAIRMLGSMDVKTLLQGVVVMGLMIAIFWLFKKLMAVGGFSVSAASVGLIAFSIGVGLLAAAAYVLGSIDPNRLYRGLIAITLLSAVFALFKVLMGTIPSLGLLSATVAFAAFAVAIDAIIIGLFALGKLKPEELSQAMKAIAKLVLLFGLFRLLTLFTLPTTILSAAASFILFSVAITSILPAVYALGKMGSTELSQAVSAIAKLTLIFAAFRVLAIGLSPRKLILAGAAFSIFASAIGILSLGVRAMAKDIGPEELERALDAVKKLTKLFSISMPIIAGFINPMKFILAAAGFAAFSAAVDILVVGVLALSKIDNGDSLTRSVDAIKRLVLIFGLFRLVMLFSNAMNLAYFTATFAGFGVAISVLALGVKMLGQLDTSDLIKGVAAVGALVLLFGLFRYLSTGMISPGSIGGFLAFSAAILVVSVALNALIPVMQQIDSMGDSWWKPLVFLAGAIGLVLAAGAVSSLGPVAVGLITLSVAVLAIGAACLLAGVGIGIAAAGLALLASVIADKGPEAASNLGVFINAMLDVIISSVPKMAQAGAAIMIALALGIGMASGALVASAVIVVLAFVEGALQAIIAAIPMLVRGLVSAIDAMAAAIRAAAPLLTQAMMGLVESLVEAVLTGIATIVEPWGAVGSAIANKIMKWIPGLREAFGVAADEAGAAGEEAADSYVDGFSGGGAGKSFGEEPKKEMTADDILANIPGVSAGATDLSSLMPEGLFNADALQSLLGDSFAELDFTSLMDGKMGDLTSSIESSTPDVEAASKETASAIETPIKNLDANSWGSEIGSNLASGLRSEIPNVDSAAFDLAQAVAKYIHFSEPDVGPLSDFHTYAPDMIKLWNKGVYDNLGSVEDSSSSMADTVYDGFSTALDYVSSLINNGMSDQLTIRPIMDLSEIQNGMDSMNGMLSGANSYAITGTSRLAASAAYGMNTAGVVTDVPANVQTDVGPTTNTFYITNSDPNAVAEKVSKILGNQTRRQKAVWAYK